LLTGKQTKKQANKQTNKHRVKHNLIGGVNNIIDFHSGSRTQYIVKL